MMATMMGQRPDGERDMTSCWTSPRTTAICYPPSPAAAARYSLLALLRYWRKAHARRGAEEASQCPRSLVLNQPTTNNFFKQQATTAPQKTPKPQTAAPPGPWKPETEKPETRAYQLVQSLKQKTTRAKGQEGGARLFFELKAPGYFFCNTSLNGLPRLGPR
jgi:hypothetical protein